MRNRRYAFSIPEAKGGEVRWLDARWYVLKNLVVGAGPCGPAASMAAMPASRVATAIACTASFRCTGVRPTMSTKLDMMVYANHVCARFTSATIWSDAPGISEWLTWNHSGARPFLIVR